MGLDDFKEKDKNDLSMIEVARAILQDRGKRIPFADLVNQVQKFMGKSDAEVRKRLPQFYTSLNTDGEFISLGDNVWALRSWFPYKSVDEEVNHPENEDGKSNKKYHQKVNAFLASGSGNDDIVDYDDDDLDAGEEDDPNVDKDQAKQKKANSSDEIEKQLSKNDDNDKNN